MIFGPDVSDFQADVDWAAVRASGRLFGFTKATEGRTFVAATLTANRQGMAAAGLVLRGLYHFARPDRNPAAAEADHFLSTVGQLGAGEIAVLDLETGNIGHAETGAWALAWLERVEAATGRTPWLYSYGPFLAAFDTSRLTRFPLWIAGYGANDGKVPPDRLRPDTDRWGRAVIWQYTSAASVPGVRGQCDDNLFEGSAAELQSLAGGKTPEAPVAGLDHLHPVFAARVANACRNRATSVYSGARSTERQRQLYNDFLAGKGNPANPPGTSWHEYGPGMAGGPDALAVDFAEPYPHGEPGLCFPVAGEPWHAQPSEITESRRVAGAEKRLPAGTTPAPSEEDQMFSPSPVRTVHLVAAHSGLLLTSSAAEHQAGVIQRKADGSLNQRWEVWGHDDGTASFVNRAGGFALDRPDYSTEPGTLLQVARNEFNGAQRWALDETQPHVARLWAPGTNRCIDVRMRSEDEGAGAQLWVALPDEDDPRHQRFVLVPTV